MRFVVVARVRFLICRAVGIGAIGAIGAGAGCAPEFAPASLITAPRVIAIVAEPPEATPGVEVTLTPTVVAPEGTLVEGPAADGGGYDATWWRCPDEDSDALGDFSQCEKPSLRRDIGTGVPFVDVVPADLFGELTIPADGPAEGAPPPEAPPEKLLGALLGYWRVVGLSMQPTPGDGGDGGADGGRIEAFKREPVYLPFALGTVDERLTDLDVRVNKDGVLEANSNPLLTAVTIHEGQRDGPTVTSVKKGGTYFFQPLIDERSLQAYGSLKADLQGIDVTDPESLKALDVDDLLSRFTREDRCEIPLFNWYVSAGALRIEVTLDETVITRVFDERGIACPPVDGDIREPATEFTAPTGEEGDPLPADGVVHGWVVLRDGRGGTAVRAFDLPLED